MSWFHRWREYVRYWYKNGRSCIVWQGPRLGFVAETGSVASIDALGTVFLFFCLAPFFHFLPFLCPYRSALRRRASSVQQSSVSLRQVCVLMSSAFCLISKSRFFLFAWFCFSWFLFYWLACLLRSRTRYVGIDFCLPWLIRGFFPFFCSLPHSPWLLVHNLCLSTRRLNQDGHWATCSSCWGERTA